MTLKQHSLAQEVKAPVVGVVDALLPTLRDWAESELYDLRYQIDLMLQLDLGNLNLAEELSLQFRQASALMNETRGDKSIPTNQKAQILNTARGMLSDIVRQQADVYSMERLKKFEVAFVKAANAMEAEPREVFFELYGKYLKDPHAASDAA